MSGLSPCTTLGLLFHPSSFDSRREASRLRASTIASWSFFSSNGRGGSSRSYHYFSCAATEIPVNCAHVSIARESWLTRLGDHLGLKDIQFESEQFNRDFRVTAKDTKFATDLVDARMMRWLEVGTGWSFEVHGPYLLASSKRLEADTILVLLDVLKAFRDHIPRVVYDLYGTGQATPTEESSTQ